MGQGSGGLGGGKEGAMQGMNSNNYEIIKNMVL